MAKREPRPKAPRQSEEGADGMTQISARVTATVSHALKRAAIEQQISGKVPNSQQGIIEAALIKWLKENKYL